MKTEAKILIAILIVFGLGITCIIAGLFMIDLSTPVWLGGEMGQFINDYWWIMLLGIVFLTLLSNKKVRDWTKKEMSSGTKEKPKKKGGHGEHDEIEDSVEVKNTISRPTMIEIILTVITLLIVRALVRHRYYDVYAQLTSDSTMNTIMIVCIIVFILSAFFVKTASERRWRWCIGALFFVATILALGFTPGNVFADTDRKSEYVEPGEFFWTDVPDGMKVHYKTIPAAVSVSVKTRETDWKSFGPNDQVYDFPSTMDVEDLYVRNDGEERFKVETTFTPQ